MPGHVAFVRALNVGGTGKLPMAELRALFEGVGCADVRTHVQSGNVVFRSRASATTLRRRLEQAIEVRMGRRHGVLLRTASELAEVLEGNPFPDAAPNRVLVLFLDEPADPEVVAATPIPGNEEMVPRGRELFVHFPDGMGRSRLKVPFQDRGTGRNINTIRKLATMLDELTPGGS